MIAILHTLENKMALTLGSCINCCKVIYNVEEVSLDEISNNMWQVFS